MGRNKANFFEKFLYKTKLKRTNYTLTQEDRDRALMIRQARAKKKLLKEEVEIQKLQKEIAEINQVSPEEKFKDHLITFLEQQMLGIVGGGTPLLSSDVVQRQQELFKDTPPSRLPKFEEVSEEEIRTRLNTINPQIRSWLKKKSDEELKVLAKEHLNLSGENLERAIEVLRNG